MFAKEMFATTEQKEKIIGLITTILELVRDGDRDIEEVCSVLQIIKEKPDFAKQLLDRTRQSLDRGISSFLKKINTITIPGTQEPFVAREKFVVGKHPINIIRIGENFEQWFLDKIEEPIGEITLCYAELINPITNRFILNGLGEKVETTLSQIYALMECQPEGENGILTTYHTNLFYSKDIKGTLRTVLIENNWGDPGWIIDAVSIDSPSPWTQWDQIFFRS